MGSNTKGVIDKLFNTYSQRFQNAQETSNERGSEFIPIVLKNGFIIFKEQTLEELNHT